MTADDLIHAARALHGRQHGSIQALATRIGVSYDSLRHMAAGRRPVPAGLAAEIRGLLAELAERPPIRVEATIARPPVSLHSGMDRDGPCGEALDPALDAVAVAAETAGWHPAEVASAVLTWATHRIADGAGEDQAIQALEDAAQIVRLRGTEAQPP